MGCPIISVAVYPRSRLAEAFQEVIVPSSVLVMMASSDDSTTAARSARASSCVGSVSGEGEALCAWSFGRIGKAAMAPVDREILPEVTFFGAQSEGDQMQ